MNRSILLSLIRKDFLAPKIIISKPTLQIIIVPPAGRFNKKRKNMPLITAKMEKQTAAIIVIQPNGKLQAVSGGRISIAETSIIPVTFIAKTATTAVKVKE